MRINPHLPDPELYGQRRRRRWFLLRPVLLFVIVFAVAYAWQVTR